MDGFQGAVCLQLIASYLINEVLWFLGQYQKGPVLPQRAQLDNVRKFSRIGMARIDKAVRVDKSRNEVKQESD